MMVDPRHPNSLTTCPSTWNITAHAPLSFSTGISPCPQGVKAELIARLAEADERKPATAEAAEAGPEGDAAAQTSLPDLNADAGPSEPKAVPMEADGIPEATAEEAEEAVGGTGGAAEAADAPQEEMPSAAAAVPGMELEEAAGADAAVQPAAAEEPMEKGAEVAAAQVPPPGPKEKGARHFCLEWCMGLH
jgi:hypothetical protein